MIQERAGKRFLTICSPFSVFMKAAASHITLQSHTYCMSTQLCMYVTTVDSCTTLEGSYKTLYGTKTRWMLMFVHRLTFWTQREETTGQRANLKTGYKLMCHFFHSQFIHNVWLGRQDTPPAHSPRQPGLHAAHKERRECQGSGRKGILMAWFDSWQDSGLTPSSASDGW